MNEFVVKGGRKLRRGYTTGSCAAAAAKAAAVMAVTGKVIPEIYVMTPAGIGLTLDVCDIAIKQGSARCAVSKDSGDDPDITNGVWVYSSVELTAEGIEIAGGQGIGIVTKSGLPCAVGDWAINPSPRRMIISALTEVKAQYGYTGGFRAVISIPGGEKIAEKTFNPRLGIVGGLSILGTTGIVDPMSEDAVIETIQIEMDALRASGCRHLLAFFGNYGVAFSRDVLNLDVSRRVTVSNYVGEMLDYAVYSRFSDVFLIGHIGKLVKIAQGIMNTHSRYGDGRTSFLALAAMLCGASRRTGQSVYDCTTTDEAIGILLHEGILPEVMNFMCRKIDYYMAQRVHGEVRTGVLVFSNAYGILGQTAGAEELLGFHRQEEGT